METGIGVDRVSCPKCDKDIISASQLFIHCSFGLLKDIFYKDEHLCYDCAVEENGRIIEDGKNKYELWVNSQWLFYGGHKHKIIRSTKKLD